MTTTQATVTFTPTQVYSGAALPKEATDLQALTTALQNAYTGTVAINSETIKSLLAATGTTSVQNFSANLLSNSLGGSVVSVVVANNSVNTQTGTVCPAITKTTSLICPTGFIPVPGDSNFGTNDFCVMKYEAKVAGGAMTSGSGGHNYTAGEVITSTATDFPISSSTQSQAITACQSLGAGYHLITNNEWMTITRNIEAQATNWNGGAVGNGYIYSGHNDANPFGAIVASTDDTLGYINTGNTGDNQKRTLTLSNGQVIWDFAGNLAEHVNQGNTIDGSNYISS